MLSFDEKTTLAVMALNGLQHSVVKLTLAQNDIKRIVDVSAEALTMSISMADRTKLSDDERNKASTEALISALEQLVGIKNDDAIGQIGS